jgi:hypothetical protein
MDSLDMHNWQTDFDFRKANLDRSGLKLRPTRLLCYPR